MKMKKICTLLLCMVMLLAMVACSDSTTPPTTSEKVDEKVEKVKISVATPTADGNPMQELVYYFQEQVDTLLPGRVEWQNYPNSAMGSEREIGEMVIDGTLNAALVGPTNIPAFAPMNAVRLQDVPFLFKNQDELYAASDEWYADMIDEECAKYGITTVFFEYIMGQEIENTKRPIYTPEDVKGLKIRVYDSLGPYKFLEACGGLPVTMAFSEVYTGLQQGAIDGVYTTSSNFVPQKFVEVTDYHTKLTVTNCGMTLLFNLDFLNSLPADLQEAIETAGKMTEEYTRNVVGPEIRNSTYEKIAAAGVEINEVTDEQYQVFANLVADYCYEDLREMIGADKWDQCVDWLKNYRANQ